MNGTLFFAASDELHGLELWQSDGTAAGTVMVADLNPGPAHSYPASITSADGRLYFAADDGFHGKELWVLLPPVASADSYTVPESGALIALDALGTATTNPNDNGLLSNDSDPTGSALSVRHDSCQRSVAR